MRSVRAVVILLLASALWAPPLAAEPSAEPWRDELPVHGPWLRDSLPDDALVYIRVPELFGFLAMPKGSMLDDALRSRANVENIQRLREGFIANVIDLIPAYAEPVTRQLQEHLQSPIEVAMFMLPAPSGVTAMTLDVDSNEEFSNILFAAGFDGVQRGLAGPLDDRGVGEVFGMPIPMFLRFEAATGRLLIHSGPAVTAESFDALLENLDSAGTHRMREMEARIDESGQGIFVWLDSQQALPAARLTMQPDDYAAMFADTGLEKFSSVAFGWGVADGKGRLSYLANLIEGADRGYVPYVETDLRLRSVGEPDALFMLTLPTSAEFTRLETRFLDTAELPDRADWLDAKDELQQSAGFTVEELFDAVGPEMVLVFDGAGEYLAISLRDRRLWERIVDGLIELPGVDVETRRIDGENYYHMRIAEELPTDLEPGELSPWIILLSRMHDHFYWTSDNDYLYVASVPQILIDRNALRPRTEVATWLEERQRIDVGNAVLSITGTSRKLPRRYYGLYLEVLEVLSDLSVANVDLWSMPTPRQLNLPEYGSIGLTISLGDPTVGVELTFENNPAELLGGLGGVAIVGIVAAIAIPAYEDYTTRAQISEGLSLSAGAKAAVAETYQYQGRFPNSSEADAMSIYSSAGKYTMSVIVEPDTGVIIATYYDDVASGGQVFLTPEVGAGGNIFWSCSGTFADKHLPAACRE